MELSHCYLEIGKNTALIDKTYTHKIANNQITIQSFKCDKNPNNDDYLVNVLVKHHSTGSLEYLDFEHIKKFYL